MDSLDRTEAAADVLQALNALLPANAVLTERADIEPFLTDWRGRQTGEALAVVLPSNVEQVSAIVRIAASADLPVFPQGGNTGLCYGAVPKARKIGIVVGLQKMNRILDVDPVANVITVEAGAILANVHAEAEKVGRAVPLHLGSEGSAQIGGLISTNAGGTGAVRYGPARDLVRGVQAVLADGDVLTDLSALVKNNTGYDLKHLFVAAEGTLGIVTAVALRMHPVMRASAHGWLAVQSPAQALMVLKRLQERFDTALMACELVSGSQVDLVLKHIHGAQAPFSETAPYNLMIEIGAVDPDAPLAEQLEELLAACIEDDTAFDGVVARSGEQARKIWHVRHSVSEANQVGGYSLTHDVAVRVSRVAEFIADCDAYLARVYPAATPFIVAHLGDGNVHYIAMFPKPAEGEKAVPDADAAAIQTAIHDIATRHGGTFSAEHGIGRKLVGELARLADPVRYRAMQTIKRAVDPAGRMNPGVLFPAGE